MTHRLTVLEGRSVKDEWVIRWHKGRRLIVPVGVRSANCRAIYEERLAGVPCHDAAHGFVTGRSTESAVRPHRRAVYVAHLDLVRFFEHCTRLQVEAGMYAQGFGEEDVEAVGRWCIYRGALPAGACTSPFLSNSAALFMDRRLSSLPYCYTRYVDNLIFSSKIPPDEGLIRREVRACGFRINESKSWLQLTSKTAVSLLGLELD